MAGKSTHYYAGGNTAHGFYGLYQSSIGDLEKLFILTNGIRSTKSAIMESIATRHLQSGYDVELIHCASDNQSLDGVIIPQIEIGIFDSTAVGNPLNSKCSVEYVNIASEMTAGGEDTADKYTEEIEKSFEAAYASFAQALDIHDEWERIYITNMDFEKHNQLTQQLGEDFFGDTYLNKKSIVRHRFLGAATPLGAKDFIPNLTEGIAKRFLLKGRPGSGKSTMLKKLAAQAEERGFDAEIYHCGFDPNSLDMVIFREAGFAIFDSTAPHEYFPSEAGDEIIDIYSLAIAPGTDEKFAADIEKISGRYRRKMNEGTAYLAQAKFLQDQLDEMVKKPADPKAITAEILAGIEDWMNAKLV